LLATRSQETFELSLVSVVFFWGLYISLFRSSDSFFICTVWFESFKRKFNLPNVTVPPTHRHRFSVLTIAEWVEGFCKIGKRVEESQYDHSSSGKESSALGNGSAAVDIENRAKTA
jgi:hypothetical protein